MKNLWTQKEAKIYSKNDLSLRVYSSRLLGRNPELVLHGGGNTSVKGQYKNIFGETIETLFIRMWQSHLYILNTEMCILSLYKYFFVNFRDHSGKELYEN